MEIAPGIYHFNTDPFNWCLLKEDSRLTNVVAPTVHFAGTC